MGQIMGEQQRVGIGLQWEGGHELDGYDDKSRVESITVGGGAAIYVAILGGITMVVIDAAGPDDQERDIHDVHEGAHRLGARDHHPRFHDEVQDKEQQVQVRDNQGPCEWAEEQDHAEGDGVRGEDEGEVAVPPLLVPGQLGPGVFFFDCIVGELPSEARDWEMRTGIMDCRRELGLAWLLRNLNACSTCVMKQKKKMKNSSEMSPFRCPSKLVFTHPSFFASVHPFSKYANVILAQQCMIQSQLIVLALGSQLTNIISSMDQFWLKYALRVAHIGSIIALSHKTISDYYSGSTASHNALFYALMGVLCMASGFANTFILKPKKMGDKRKLWVGYHHLKLLVTLVLYSPLGNLIGESGLINLRMLWILSIIIVSPFMRFYREKWSTQQPI